MMMEQV